MIILVSLVRSDRSDYNYEQNEIVIGKPGVSFEIERKLAIQDKLTAKTEGEIIAFISY
jgi:hypothetical protein